MFWHLALRTPLHAAAVAEDVAGLQLVLRHGADINAVDHSGRSALMVAADNGQSGAVGKRCTMCDMSNSRLKPSDVVKCDSVEFLVVISDILLLLYAALLLHRAKADLSLLDVNKNTALHLACSKVTNTALFKLNAD